MKLHRTIKSIHPQEQHLRTSRGHGAIQLPLYVVCIFKYSHCSQQSTISSINIYYIYTRVCDMYDVMLPPMLLACGGGSVMFVVCGWKWCC